MSPRSFMAISLALALAAAPPRPQPSPSPGAFASFSWQKGEGYGVLVERGPLGSPAAARTLFLFHPVRGSRGQDLLVLALDSATGATTGAFKLETREGSRQPHKIEPLAFILDANNLAMRAQSESDPIACEGASGAEDFLLLTVPMLGGPAWIPYWTPVLNGTDPVTTATGTWIDLASAEGTKRIVRQTWRRDDHGELILSFRGEHQESPIFGSAHYRANVPLPVFGQILDADRGEVIRFRLVFHTQQFTRALSMGRGAAAGDPAMLPPEALLDAESVWQPAARDLVADEVVRQIAADRKWTRVEARGGLPVGELVPFAYELFALQGSVTTGEKAPDAKKRPVASPRGAIGILFAGRFESQETGVKYEAWLIPGADERAQENERIAATAESTGRLVVRLLLGRAAVGLWADRPWFLAVNRGWWGEARAAKPKKMAKLPAEGIPPRGSDAILIRRESDLAPVLLAFYRLSDDLRTPRVFASLALDGVGSTSVVRRSLLERAKDFFLVGGFSAFTNKKGASLVLTRGAEETTQIDRLTDRGCGLEFLSEVELPEEPWKIPMDPRAPKQTLWGTPMAFAVGRNRYGDNRPPRDCLIRRSDGEELLAYEAWEVDRPWWSLAVTAYPQQGVGVRFRPLIHARLEAQTGDGNPAENDLLPFLPPPPPPQPNSNPKTPPAPKETEKPKPDPKIKKPVPAPPPPAPGGSTPKTGG